MYRLRHLFAIVILLFLVYFILYTVLTIEQFLQNLVFLLYLFVFTSRHVLYGSFLTLSFLMYSPAHIMPLLEIVRTEKTSAQVILDLMTVGKIIKKVPVVVGNCTGFAVNRTFFPYAQGAHFLVNLGVDVFQIDRAISNFGLPMGPFQ